MTFTNDLGETLGEAIQTFERTNEEKGTGRVFGYIFGIRPVVGSREVYAWLQRGVADKSGDFKDYGVSQRSRKFDTLAQARAWQRAQFKKRAAGIVAVRHA